MAHSEVTAPKRGRPIVAWLAVGWVGLGFWAVESGDMWRAGALVAFGIVMMSTYLWPDTGFARFMEASPFRKK